jgi:hypothetical protein
MFNYRKDFCEIDTTHKQVPAVHSIRESKYLEGRKI